MELAKSNNASIHASLATLQRQILDLLLACKKDAADAGGSVATTLPVLLQQYYMAVIARLCDTSQWSKASKAITEAFLNVPVALQKPLWRLRVVALSKQGKNVLDGIQKMISGGGAKDPSLQARVYAILARASSLPKQQLDAYRKTIELLTESDSIERVDYVLETVTWMSAYGLPRHTMEEMLCAALDVFYEIDDSHLTLMTTAAAGGVLDEGDDDESVPDGGSAVSSAGGAASVTGSKAGSKQGTASKMMSRQPSKASMSQAGSRGGTAASRKQSVTANSRVGTGGRKSRGATAMGQPETTDDNGLPLLLNAKHCEQGIRSAFMLAMLESNEARRLDKLLEGVYFVSRSLELWSEALRETDKMAQYVKLTQVERDETPYGAFNPPSGDLPPFTLSHNTYLSLNQPPALILTRSYPNPLSSQSALILIRSHPNPPSAGQSTSMLMFPCEPLDLLGWMPNPLFVEITATTARQQPDKVPGPPTYPLLPLTAHYALWACDELHRLGRQKHALHTLGWLRALMFTGLSTTPQKEYLLAAIHYKSLVILYSCRIPDSEVMERYLAPTLGNPNANLIKTLPLINLD